MRGLCPSHTDSSLTHTLPEEVTGGSASAWAPDGVADAYVMEAIGYHGSHTRHISCVIAMVHNEQCVLWVDLHHAKPNAS